MNDGGPAFPHVAEIVSHDPETGNMMTKPITDGGMSLRDYFAAAALQGLIANPRETELLEIVNNQHGPTMISKLVMTAFLTADGMIAAREGKPSQDV